MRKTILTLIGLIGGYVLHFPFRFLEDWIIGLLQRELLNYWSIFLTWVLPFIVAIGLVYSGYFIRSRKTSTALQSPIKAIVPSPSFLELDIAQFVKNVKDDSFQITTSIEIDVENNTDHVIKIERTNLILLFDKKCSVQSLLYRQLFTDGREGWLERYPIVIQPYSTRSQNMFRIDYFDVEKINRKFINKAPKKSWVYFELVGVKNTEEYRPIDMAGVEVNWRDYE